ncbi:hypothetical protein QA641_31495 [Bradyrhizobium sp. CB1650]|uniref:hypothetical protein n=1 Tax=Bradyrhizobium sp. CB1650 TaxID=3039153 RepID=UPI0024348991|nr:hypothetical protein [Bradyrhizobium sp. CB1650]WGD50116.1 hypothetical protein QA641_31495 [Bradyrhizobium sp. CB1650]
MAYNAIDHHSALQLVSWFLSTFRHDNPLGKPLGTIFNALERGVQVRPMRNDYSESNTMM